MRIPNVGVSAVLLWTVALAFTPPQRLPPRSVRSRSNEAVSSPPPETPVKTVPLRKRDKLLPWRRSRLEREALEAAELLLTDSCEMEEETAEFVDVECADEGKLRATIRQLSSLISSTVSTIRPSKSSRRSGGAEDASLGDEALLGDILEAGWEQRGSGSAIRRNVEVWKFGAAAALKVVKVRKIKDDPAAKSAASTAAAEFIRDGLLRLGPTFVKFGQVLSTRTDVFSKEYIDVLKSLQDDVPAFDGQKAREIIAQELKVDDVSELFSDFSEKPIAAASLGQVHTAFLKKGNATTKVAIKVQRAGLKELFDVDLVNLKKLAELLDKFDPKSDGADRDWVNIYEESSRLLYLEIDYLNEARNAIRFAEDFKNTPWVRTPDVYFDLSTPRVLTMEFVETEKLTDIAKMDELGLDKNLLSKRAADAFLTQVVQTGYFHCDPHPGNLAVDKQGNLVFFDYGMMDELKPNVRLGFQNLCFALFEGGPFIDDLVLSEKAKQFVLALGQMGVLAKGADQLAVEKFARFCIRTFKDQQLGKKGANIKSTIGTDLQTLTEADVFRFPSTFTFIFRAFASVDGIGKGLSKDFDIGKLSQPYIEELVETVKYEDDTEFTKGLKKFGTLTGLNSDDINVAVTSPRKIAYIESTLRSMEEGSLKIRVRSLENEKALERMALTQSTSTNLLAASIFLNVGMSVSKLVPSVAAYLAAAAFGAQALGSIAKCKAFDKKAKLYTATEFSETR